MYDLIVSRGCLWAPLSNDLGLQERSSTETRHKAKGEKSGRKGVSTVPTIKYRRRWERAKQGGNFAPASSATMGICGEMYPADDERRRGGSVDDGRGVASNTTGDDEIGIGIGNGCGCMGIVS